MDNDISEEDNLDGSSFLESLEFFSDEIFKINPELQSSTLDLVARKKSEIENLIGWKQYERIKRRLEEISK